MSDRERVLRERKSKRKSREKAEDELSVRDVG